MSDLLSQEISFTLLFRQLLALRGFEDPAMIEMFLESGVDRLEDPFLMKGMEEAAGRIRQAVRGCEKILVHGDYDVDGITGTALMVHLLGSFQADFDTFLPDRQLDGYGLSESAILLARQKGAKLLIAVDCGIAAAKEIESARSCGIDVIVIDHHRIPAGGLPPATVILNPLQEDCSYPFKDLSAAGLVFKLSQALCGEAAFRYLDLVALSTVSDVAPLLGENRIFVKQGLKVFGGKGNMGLRVLSEIAGLKSREINAGHLGFVLGPRINAAGRMSSPETALRLLVTSSNREAQSLAKILNEENKLRQKQERQVVKEAVSEVEKHIHFNRDRVIVVEKQGWHPGVIGIVASRLVEKYYRPAVVISVEGDNGKGSGRSIKGFHLFRALESCKDLFEDFGGHEQAAGLTIRKKNIPRLRLRINQYALENFPVEVFERHIVPELEIDLSELKPPFLSELALLEPYGMGNPRPQFLTKNVQIKGKPIRLSPQTLKCWVTDGDATYEALVPDQDENLWLVQSNVPFDMIYTVKMRTWNGLETVSLDVKEIKPQP